MTTKTTEPEGMEPWDTTPGRIMPYDMVVPAAEVTVSPEQAMKAIDYLAEVMANEKVEPKLRVQAASAIVMHHAKRRPL